MTAPWTPPLRLTEVGGRCRLWLGGYACGDGATLQEAADDLVRRVTRLARASRSGAGFRISCETGPPDLPWLEFLHELGQIVAAGGDVRPRVLG